MLVVKFLTDVISVKTVKVASSMRRLELEMRLKEEVRKYVANKLVSVDIMKRITPAVLPFMFNDLVKLVHNTSKALQV